MPIFTIMHYSTDAESPQRHGLRVTMPVLPFFKQGLEPNMHRRGSSHIVASTTGETVHWGAAVKSKDPNK
jgi:hypothetical protein